MVSDVRHAAGDEQRTWAPRGATGKWYSHRNSVFRAAIFFRATVSLPPSPPFSSSPAEPEMVPAGRDGVCGLMAYQGPTFRATRFEGTCCLKRARPENRCSKTDSRPTNSRSSALFLVLPCDALAALDFGNPKSSGSKLVAEG